MAKTEIFLTLDNKFEAVAGQAQPAGHDKSQKLFVATKQMLISILRCCHGDNLREMIIRPASIDEQVFPSLFFNLP